MTGAHLRPSRVALAVPAAADRPDALPRRRSARRSSASRPIRCCRRAPAKFVRPYLLARREGLSVTATFTTIILERLLDLVTVLLLFGVFVLFFDPGLDRVNPAIYQSGQGRRPARRPRRSPRDPAGAGPERRPTGADRTACRRLPAPAAGAVRGPRLGPGLRPRSTGSRSPATRVRLAQARRAVVARCGSRLRGHLAGDGRLSYDDPFTGSFLILALLVVGVAVPTPGAVGGFHEAFRIGATVFYGVDNDRAVGAAIVLHAVSFLPVTLLGGLFMFQDGLNLARVRRLGDEARASRGAAVAAPRRRAADAGRRSVARAEVSLLRSSRRQGRRLAGEPRRRRHPPPARVPGMRAAASPATSASTRSRTWSSRRTAGGSGSSGRS